MSGDVPLRDAAQALLTAWEAVQALDPPMTHTEADSLSRAEDAGNDAARALRAALAAADTAPAELIDGIPEDLHTDIESEIHQHCGHDGQSDEANDWVTDLMAAIAPLISRALAAADGTTPTVTDDERAPVPDAWVAELNATPSRDAATFDVDWGGTTPTQPDAIHRGVTLQDIEGDVMTSAIAVPFAPGTLVEVRRVVATPTTEGTHG